MATDDMRPMEAKLAAELPHGDAWQYEPKWDGFRCLARREGDMVSLTSKSGKPLGRYFPEIEAMLAGLRERHFLIDGELIIPIGDTLSFAALQARLHPAASRVERLARETPAELMLFDCLAVGRRTLADRPLTDRRAALERFHAAADAPALRLSPCTRDRDTALGWLAASGGALDGVIAKRRDRPYEAGERAMIKVKQHRTADCVVGGFRYDGAGTQVASLLLGLHDAEGLLHHVGFTSGIAAADKPALTARLEALIAAPGFTGDAPGGPSRWATERSAAWQPLAPLLVAEVRYDQVTGRRFRHGTAFLRWRPDKAPEDCGFDQLQRELRPAELARITRDAGKAGAAR